MANYDSTYITEHASHFDFESTPRNNKMIGNTMQNRTMFWGENHGNVWQSNTTSLNMWSTPVRKKVKQTANTKNNNRVEGWSIGCTETIWRGIFGQIDRKNLLIQKFTIVTSWLRSHALQVASVIEETQMLQVYLCYGILVGGFNTLLKKIVKLDHFRES